LYLNLRMYLRGEALMTVPTASQLRPCDPPTTTTPVVPDWQELPIDLHQAIAGRAAAHDRDGTFVADNYCALKEHRIFSAQIPTELGGGGASYNDIALLLRSMAHACPSTALAVSMHQHLVGTMLWKWKNAGGSDALLRRVAAEQCVLVSTGANDWLESNGTLERTDANGGGYLVTAIKRFASGSIVGDFALTSGAYTDPQQGERVLHFVASLRGNGVSILNDWDTHGMRGTGSNAIRFDRAFIPDAAITLDRPRGAFHPFFSVVLMVAMPMVMNVYLGVAERAAELALAAAGKGKKPDELTFQLAGELERERTICRLAVDDMMRLTNGREFKPSNELSSQMLARKAIAARSAIRTVEKAVELCGGSAFYRASELERLMRDVRGGHYHPLPEKAQQRFTGRVLLGRDPVAE
jgi:alkylation response protein AidB-like acyl-CoA dehydrogenase